MRALLLMLTVAVTALAGCNRSPSIEAHNASAADVAKKVAAAGGVESFIRAGKWQTSVTIDSIDAPGMPPAAKSQIRANAQTVGSCVTPEQAKKPTPEMFSGDRGNCRYDRFAMGGGKLDMVMRCSGGHAMGVGSTMTMTGTYDPDNYHMSMTSKTETGAPDMGPMTMKMHLDARRIGECDAKG